MPNDVAELTLKINSNQVTKADSSLKGLNRTAIKTDKEVNDLGQTFRRMAAKVGLVTAGAAALWSTFNNVRTLQRLNAQLKTATGTTEDASIAFESLQQTALQMPNTLEEITEAFIVLKNLGLDPSEKAILSYGNTAAAMGRSLDQFIQAVADATTREFERLKEFGIRASQEGDRVRFTFRNVTTEIGNNAREIEKFLQDLGNQEFAGSMAAQMDTIDGQLSQLSDAWFQFTTAVGESSVGTATGGFLEVLTDSLRGLTSFQQAQKLVEQSIIQGFESFKVSDIGKIEAALENSSVLESSRNQEIRAGLELRLKELKALQEADGIIEAQEKSVDLEEKKAEGLRLVNKIEEDINRTLQERLELKQKEIASTNEEILSGQATDLNAAEKRLRKQISERQKFEDEIKKEADFQIQEERRVSDERLRIRQNFYSDLFTIAKDGSSDIFKVSRGFAIADATITGIKAVQQAWGSAPFPANLAAVAFTTAETLANVQRIKSVGNFAGGGIVPGNSFSGDSQQANVNSGEMILNRMQQANLFSMANGVGRSGAVSVVINNNAGNAQVSAQENNEGQLVVTIIERAASAAQSRINQDLSRGDGSTSRAFKSALARERR